MAELGADPDDLRALAEEFLQLEYRLRRSTGTVIRHLRSVAWHGSDSHRFRARWDARARDLSDIGATALAAADELRRQAADQESASGALPGAVAGPPPPPAGHTVAVGAPAGASPLPVRSESWTLGVGAAVALGLATGTTVTIETLGNGRAVVSVKDAVGGTLSGGLGFEAGIDDALELELEAAAAGGVSVEQRRAWMVDDTDIAGFLMRLGAREGIDRLPMVGANPVTGLFAEHALRRVGLGVGDPDSVDTWIRFEGSLGAEASAVATLLGLSGASASAVGWRQDGSGRTLLVQGSAAGEARTGAGNAAVTTTTTLEIPLQRSGPQTMTATTSTVSDGSEVVQRRGYELRGDPVAAGIGDAADALAKGDLPGAVGSLETVLREMPGEPTWADSATGAVDDDVHRVGAGVLLGPKLSGEVEGGRTITDYSGSPPVHTNPHVGGGGGTW